MKEISALDAKVRKALRFAEAQGLICYFYHLEDRAFFATPTKSWRKLAESLAATSGGVIWCGNNSITWTFGRIAVWIFDGAQHDKISDARSIVWDVTGNQCGWSYGQCARALLKWIGAGHDSFNSGLFLPDQIEYGYHDCAPGHYNYASLWDVKSCYFSLMSRLPSLQVTPTREKLIWHETPEEQMDKFRVMVGAIAEHKVLRNSIVGCMVGKLEQGEVCTRTGWKKIKTPSGKYLNTGLLIVRSAWELCREASEETDSVYSVVDCVVSLGIKKPEAWERRGLETRLQEYGAAEIHGFGMYQVGNKRTQLINDRVFIPMPIARAAAPEISYTDLWL